MSQWMIQQVSRRMLHWQPLRNVKLIKEKALRFTTFTSAVAESADFVGDVEEVGFVQGNGLL